MGRDVLRHRRASPTQFQYQQYGPNGSTTAVGTVTPFGQAAPGFHLMRCNFLTRQGAVLKSSPYVKFIANGGQYLQISNIPIGPENVIGRILEFTGADGAYFFYIPTHRKSTARSSEQPRRSTTTQRLRCCWISRTILFLQVWRLRFPATT